MSELPPFPESPFQAPASVLESPARRRRGPLFWGCLGLAAFFLLLVGSCVALLATKQGNLRPLCDAYLAQTQSGDLRGAYEGTSERFKKITPTFEEFQAMEQFVRSTLGALQDKTQTGIWFQELVGDSLARVAFNGRFEKGEARIIFDFVKEGGAWKIYGIHYYSPLLAKGLTCPACGHVNAFGAAFCAHCGKPLKAGSGSP